MSTDAQLDSASQATSEIQVPSTPIPQNATLPASKPVDATAAKPTSPIHRASSSDMTPPPSSQPVNSRSPPIFRPSSRPQHYPASPPATVRANHPVSFPSDEELASAGEHELRSMVKELMGAVREARISAAHFKLQHSLLAMESYESAQRAQIEHQMTKREVEVLQAENRSRQSSSQPQRAPVASPQSAPEPLLTRCRELELELGILDRRLRRAKRLIEDERDRGDQLQDRTEILQEENSLLKRRIRENREHMTMLKAQTPIFSNSPRHEPMTPQRRPVARYPDTGESQHSAFHALLAAGQVMNGEPISVPSTPTKTPASKVRHGHTRGAHSLSSLNSTPANRSAIFSQTPKAERLQLPAFDLTIPPKPLPSRHDRDSTISISGSEGDRSENNENSTEDVQLPQSQASSLATSMLRRNPGPIPKDNSSDPSSQESLSQQHQQQETHTSASKQSSLLQAKLFGQVKKMASAARKAGIENLQGKKRKASHGSSEDNDDGDVDLAEKKRRLLGMNNEWQSPRVGGNQEGVGLGIGRSGI